MTKRNFRVLFLLLCSWVISLAGCSTGDTGVEIKCPVKEVSVFQGEKLVLNFEITNHLKDSIRPGTNHFISYHLYDGKGNIIAYDNPRFSLPRVLRRRQTTGVELILFFGHAKPGNYIAEFDIVKEGEFWGSSKKWRTAKIKLHLKPLVSDEFKEKYLDFFCSTGNPLLDREQYLLRMTLKNSELVTADGKLFGFSAGSDYPQVWIRDSATFIACAKRYYPLETLANSVELFFEHQSADGEVVDWVDVSGKTDKMTVETDQESSLVLAAYEIGKENASWFHKKINGYTVLERLDMALQWVWQNKRSPEYNMIYSGFTADWGDTENTFPDQRATKLSERSTLVFSIYTQAKYLQAMDCLLKILQLANEHGYRDRIRVWQARRVSLKTQALKHLYLEDKGYFISHIVPTGDKEKYFKMEKEMLAVGGNAEAMIAGLMNREHIKKFLEVLAERREQYNLRTVSFTLIPPYPEGFFPHHLLKHPWNYQNGGEWDWIGGRVVKALFMKGFAKEAESYLLEIVKKNLANNCIFEWEDRQGTGRGAMFYAGAAGVIGEAILLGYNKALGSRQ
jgi:GH15 family glucan-1,4-alpha-glucosidase